jgi:hypothetical protein
LPLALKADQKTKGAEIIRALVYGQTIFA